MNRDIKFRVWNGFEMVRDVAVSRFGVFYVNPSNNGLDPKDSASLTPFTTRYHNDTPVMQYTGLIDKNGIDIYEGDLLFSQRISEVSEDQWIVDVVYEQGSFCYGWHGDPLEEIECSREMEIIGNVYQNPELKPKDE